MHEDARPTTRCASSTRSCSGAGRSEDGDWDAPTLLFAVGDVPAAFAELGQGGAAVINARAACRGSDGSTRAHDVYVHVADQTALNARIEQLLSAR